MCWCVLLCLLCFVVFFCSDLLCFVVFCCSSLRFDIFCFVYLYRCGYEVVDDVGQRDDAEVANVLGHNHMF